MTQAESSVPVRIDFQERDSRFGFMLALILHIGLVLAVLVKGVLFPGKPIPYVPALRVDLVGLPDVLKKDLDKIPKAPNKEIEKALEAKPKPPEPKPVPKIEPKAPPPKVVPKAEDEVGLKPKANKAADTKQREKKLMSALDRIRALEKIKESTDDAKPQPSVVVKGNKVSKGSSLSANAKESEMSNYYDQLRDRIQENWALPVWLARQNLAAQVMLFVDARGHVRGVKFVKSSGNNQFDDAVRAAIRESDPMPTPPEELSGSLSSNGILVGFPL